MMLKLFVIDSQAETDWIAAHDADEARRCYMREYELDERDMEYVEISLVDDPETVTVYLDEVDAETEEQCTETAAEVMSKMTRAGLVASTVNM